VQDRQGESTEAIKSYGKVLRRFGKAKDTALRHVAILALVHMKSLRMDRGKNAEARGLHRRVTEIAGEDKSLQRFAELFRVVPLTKTGKDIFAVYGHICEAFASERAGFSREINKRTHREEEFLGEDSCFPPGEDSPAFLLDLREWNSYTPAVPEKGQANRGGGYFIRYRGQGIVIDPGYDFIRNFAEADGRICDIHHIVITHAHIDHTQDFATLLSLLREYNKRPKNPAKCVHLYLSQGVAWKFSGELPLRDCLYLGTTTILNRGRETMPQVIPLCDLPGARLTVVRAYHDDVLSAHCAVGLGFEFRFGKTSRKVLFTGDTSLFPAKGVEGKRRADVDPEMKNALFRQYPKKFRRPDILILHIGSIKEQELDPERFRKWPKRPSVEELYFYPDHLGLFGTVVLLLNIRPKAAIIGELGEELKTIRFKMVRKIGEVLKEYDEEDDEPVFVVPGDLTLIYDIERGEFFCHGSRKYVDPSKLEFLEIEQPDKTPFYSRGVCRTYLFSGSAPDPKQGKIAVDGYYSHVKQYGMPYGVEWPKP